jgi:hypothetical protein
MKTEKEINTRIAELSLMATKTGHKNAQARTEQMVISNMITQLKWVLK